MHQASAMYSILYLIYQVLYIQKELFLCAEKRAKRFERVILG